MLFRSNDTATTEIYTGPYTLSLHDALPISGRSRTGVEQWLNGLKSCTVYRGHARFLSAREVAVGAEVLRAEKIFINVGGRAFIPPLPGLKQVPYLTNSSIMDVDFLPEHLVVSGAATSGSSSHRCAAGLAAP